MDIKEAQKRKRILERDIVSLINALSKESGLTITNIKIDEMLYQLGKPKHIASISLEVLL